MTSGFTISTPRLRLRALQAGDAGAFHACVTDPAIGRMLFRFPPDWPLDAVPAFLADCAFDGRPRFRLAISDAGGAFLGSIGVSDEDEADVPEVFYFLTPAAAGRGLGREALSAFSTALFARFPLLALQAGVFTDNPASARVLSACGYLCTGEGMATSLARLEPAPVWHYRLDRPTESPAS